MPEQLRVVLKSYNRWFVHTLVVVGLGWLGFVAWYVQGEYLAPFDYFILLGPILFAFFLALGFKLKSEFVPTRARLIPNWSASHLVIALGLSVVIVSLLAGTAALSLSGNLRQGPWEEASYAGILGFFWLGALLFLSMGYFSNPVFAGVVPLVFALMALTGGDGFRRLFSIFVQGRHPRFVAMVLLLDAVGSIALVWRMLHVDEEMSERRWLLTFDAREQQQQAWASAEHGIRQRISSWMLRSLDSIPRPLRPDLPSQMRHFQLGIVAGQGFLAVSVLLVLIFWTIRLVTGTRVVDSNYFLWTLFPIYSTFAQVMSTQRNSFQWMFLLPLRRREIVIRYFGALLASVLKMWFSFFLAIFVVQWMPFPGTIKGLPPPLPMIESFAALFPVFGVMLLVLLWPREARAKRVIALTILVAALIIAIAVTIAGVSGRHDPAPVFTIAAFITGIGMIWFSYRCWIQADLG